MSVGTSTTSNTTKLLIVASSTASGSYALRIIQPGGTSLLSVQNDGAVSIPGTLTAGTFSGTTSAGNVSAGQFGLNTGGGNFAFPASVGIGTTTSTVPLAVVGNPSSQPVLNITNTGTNGSVLYAGYSGGIGTYLGIKNGTASTYAFDVAEYGVTPQVHLFYVRGDGNVGIGTANPSQKLEVSGSIKLSSYIISSSTYLGVLDTTGVNAQPVKVGSLAITDNYSNSAPSNGLYVQGNVGIGTTNPTSTLTVVGEIKSTTGGVRFPDGTLQTSAGAASLWNASGTAIYNNNSGNVGIGISTPASPAGFANIVHLRGAVNASYVVDGGGSYRGEFGVSSAGGWVSTADSIPLRFITVNVERMRIASSGLVGIGTTNPGGQLSVVNNSASQIGFILRNAASQTGNIFEIQNSAGSPTIMTVNGSNGNAFFGFNVGIGTSTPGALLELYNNSTPTLKFNSVSNVSNIKLVGATDDFDFINNSTWGTQDQGARIRFFTNNDTATPKMIIRKDGSVGIGTIAPTSTLTVVGEIKSTSGGVRFPDGTLQSTAASAGISGSGTTNSVPLWTGSTALGNSAITQPTSTTIALGSAGLAVGTTTTQTAGNGYFTGTVTATTFLGTHSAASVSSGSFGANTGGGNYTFPASLTVNGTLFGAGSTATYGSITIDGIKNTWSGINFKSSGTNLQTLMISSSIFGSYNNLDNAWNWYWTGGTLTQGAIPAANVTAGTFGAGNYSFPGHIGLQGATISNNYGADIEGTNTSIIFGPSTDMHINSNAYYNAGWKYKTTGVASNLYVYNGIVAFRVAPSGLAGAALTWIDAMTIANGGNVGIGTTNPTSTLTVVGEIKSTTGGVRFPDGTLQATAGSGIVTAGNVSAGQFGLNTGGGTYTFSGGIGRSAHSSGFLLGSYNNVGANDAKTNPIYTIGSSYVPTDTTLGNMYGIGYAHPNLLAWGAGKSTGWGLYVASAGIIYDTISDGGMWASGTITAGGVLSGGSISTAGALSAGSISTTGAMSAASYQVSGTNYLTRAGGYNYIYDPAGTVVQYQGSTDPGTYNDNTTHYFRNRGGAATYATLNASGLGIGTTPAATTQLGVSSAQLGGWAAGGTHLRVTNTAVSSIDISAGINLRAEDFGILQVEDTAGTVTGVIANSPSFGYWQMYGGNGTRSTYDFTINNATGNIGFGTASPVFDGNGQKYVAVNNTASNGSSEFGVGGNIISPGPYTAGQLSFFNSAIGVVEKRIATIVGRTDGGVDSGALDFYTTWFGSFGTAKMTIANQGNVGIGNGNPGYKLDVVSAGGTTARFGTAGTDTVVIGGGAGKIDVGTVDPPYTINGEHFATYGAEMTGVKGETTGNGILICSGAECKTTIDFAGADKGSDLWLFAKTTDLKNHFSNLTVLLTPAFDGRIWYEKSASGNKLTVYAVPNGAKPATLEFSYRFTAPRFDAAKWLNATGEDSSPGFVIND